MRCARLSLGSSPLIQIQNLAPTATKSRISRDQKPFDRGPEQWSFDKRINCYRHHPKSARTDFVTTPPPRICIIQNLLALTSQPHLRPGLASSKIFSVMELTRLSLLSMARERYICPSSAGFLHIPSRNYQVDTKAGPR